MRKSTCGDPAWTTSRSYLNLAFSITFRGPPPGTSQSVTASRSVYPIEEPENRAWALLFAPTTLVVLPST
jgi:hypothetical protein